MLVLTITSADGHEVYHYEDHEEAEAMDYGAQRADADREASVVLAGPMTAPNAAQAETLRSYSGAVIDTMVLHNEVHIDGRTPLGVDLDNGWSVRLGAYGGVLAEHKSGGSEF